MSCNGCRVLRKGCSDTCMLRQCLQLIDSPQAQAHATLFVAKFFGRAALMSFVSAVPASHRPGTIFMCWNSRVDDSVVSSVIDMGCGCRVRPWF